MGTVINGTIAPLISSNNKGILSSQVKIKDVLNFYKINRYVNRDLSPNRLPKIIKYIDNKDTEVGIFLPSLVFSYAGDPHDCYDPRARTVTIKDEIRLTVLDGQHRIKSLEDYVNKIKDPIEKEKFLNNFLTVQIYFGLSMEEEKTLFIDINSNAKRVSMSLVTKYDSRDIMNILATELYNSSIHLQTIGIEFNKSRILRPHNSTFTTSMRLKAFISYLFYKKKSLNFKEEEEIKNNYDSVFNFLVKLFQIIVEVLPEVPGDVKTYILGHEAVQNAIALYLHDSIIINHSGINWLEHWESEVEQLELIEWSVKNKIWKHLLIENHIGNEKNYFQSIPNSYIKEVYEIITEQLT